MSYFIKGKIKKWLIITGDIFVLFYCNIYDDGYYTVKSMTIVGWMDG